MDNLTRLRQEVGLKNLRDVIVCRMPLEERIETLLDDFCLIALEDPDAGRTALEMMTAYLLAQDTLLGHLPDVTKHTN